MRSLAKAVKSRGSEGEALPQPIRAIRDLGFVQRRGQLSLWIAAPGVGKSIVALHHILKCGVPGLYVSCDTDRSDQGNRAMALLTGESMDEVKANPGRHLEALDRIPKDVRFEFDSAPTDRHLLEMVEAYAMVFGQYPELIVVDTIGKVWSEVGDENARNKEAVTQCQEIARHTGAHVMALHHATKFYDAGDKPIPLDGLMSGVSKVPEQVISMWRDQADRVCFAPLKNRSGPSDPSAMRLRAWTQFRFDRCQIEDIPPVVELRTWADEGLAQ